MALQTDPATSGFRDRHNGVLTVGCGALDAPNWRSPAEGAPKWRSFGRTGSGDRREGHTGVIMVRRTADHDVSGG
jgi:hypothetical protein